MGHTDETDFVLCRATSSEGPVQNIIRSTWSRLLFSDSWRQHWVFRSLPDQELNMLLKLRIRSVFLSEILRGFSYSILGIFQRLQLLHVLIVTVYKWIVLRVDLKHAVFRNFATWINLVSVHVHMRVCFVAHLWWTLASWLFFYECPSHKSQRLRQESKQHPAALSDACRRIPRPAWN